MYIFPLNFSKIGIPPDIQAQIQPSNTRLNTHVLATKLLISMGQDFGTLIFKGKVSERTSPMTFELSSPEEGTLVANGTMTLKEVDLVIKTPQNQILVLTLTVQILAVQIAEEATFNQASSLCGVYAPFANASLQKNFQS